MLSSCRGVCSGRVCNDETGSESIILQMMATCLCAWRALTTGEHQQDRSAPMMLTLQSVWVVGNDEEQ